MKVLSVVWFKVLPAKYGGQKGTALFNQHLGKLTELTCLCSKNNEEENAFSYKVVRTLPTNKWQFINPLIWHTIYRTSKKLEIDALIIEYPYHAISAVITKSFLKTKLVLHEHNIEYLRFKQLGKWWWKVLFWYECWACKRADLILFKTQNDIAEACANFNVNKRKCMVVPYGVVYPSNNFKLEDVRKVYNISATDKVLLFAATLDYEPNANAFVNIVQKLIPALERLGFFYKIIVSGRCVLPQFQFLKKLHHPNLIFVGEVKAVEPFFEVADFFINPVLETNGVQTKILDAISHGCTVIAFDNAAKGINIPVTGNKIFLVKQGDWSAFAACVKHTSNESKTPASFYETYNWDSITKAVVERLKEV